MKYETEKYEDVFSYKVINRTYEFTSIVKNSDNKKALNLLYYIIYQS